MSTTKHDKRDYKPLAGRSVREAGKPNDLKTLRRSNRKASNAAVGDTLVSPSRHKNHRQPALEASPSLADDITATQSLPAPELTRKQKKYQKRRELLVQDKWLVRNGHTLTFIGLYLFSVMTLFRPYDIVPSFGILLSATFYFAIATLAIYIPSQLAIEGNLTILSTEVKAVIAMVLIALITMPIARDPGLAWTAFNDTFIKAVAMFIVMVNVIRTRKRLMAIMWLSLGMAIYLSVMALNMNRQGILTVEGYRVSVETTGMFGNPNEMALHLVMMTPIVIALGLAAKKHLRLVYFGLAAIFIGATMITYSRGGFLGLLVCMAFFAWKVGRKYRLNVAIASVVVGGLAIILSPGNYGQRMLSIFVPSLDAVGSSDHRQVLLVNSIWASIRNPQGIGIGNSPLFGANNLQTHNAYTQVSSELGILGLIAYLIFVLSPFRRLAAIERSLLESDDLNWFYYLSIGLQASLVGYLVSSFFASVAYNWFIYYLIAYAVAFRRVYSVEMGLNEETMQSFPLKTAQAT